MKKIGRNDPCPCGSGLKYKKCHALHADDPYKKAALDPMTDEVTAEAAPPLPTWTRYVPHGLMGLGAVGAIAAWMSAGTQGALAVVAGTILFVAGWYTFSNPPDSRPDSGDPAGLNFGRKD